LVEPLPYSASLIGPSASDRNVSFGNYPTTPFAERRVRRHRPEPWNCGRRAAADPASAQSGTGEPVWRHALSLFGDVKYPVDFKRFDYVNPDAPKGGVARQILIGTFDNFNLAVAGVKGSLASAVALVYESLTTPSLDEVSTEYGALAESVSHPEDFSPLSTACGRRRNGTTASR
jgi:ABC-type oligopeptide transport system, periplasmic component